MALADIAHALGAENAEDVLLPGEHALQFWAANALVADAATLAWVRERHQAWNRGAALELAADALGAALRTDSVGGILSLTDWRLFFASHVLNVHQGHFSVFLPNVVVAREEATELGPKLAVVTHANVHLFTVPEPTKLAEAILAARDALGAETPERLREAVAQHLDRTGAGLRGFWRRGAESTSPESLHGAVLDARRTGRLHELVGALEVLDSLGVDWRD